MPSSGNLRQKENAAARAKEEQQLKEQRIKEAAARERFLKTRSSFSDMEQIELEDQALSKCNNTVIRRLVLSDRQTGTIGTWHQMLWEQHIIATLV